MAERRLLVEADNAAVGVADGVIVEPAGRFDLELRLPGRTIRPGLINAHDHLHRNHYGRLGAPPYTDACAWARDVERRYEDRIAAGRLVPRREALLIGAWKNLFAGVTTVVHHDRWEADFEDGFPLCVARLAWADSLGMSPELDGVRPSYPFGLHLAEGTGETASREVHELEARGLLDANLIAVHGVGMDPAAIALFRSSGAALVWCSSSNLFLLGRTAPAELLREGIDVLLGSDSLLTGAGNLLDELRVARSTGLVSDRRLEDAVGATAARRLGMRPRSLRPGEPADLVILSAPLLEATAENVELVLVGGIPRVAHPAVAETLERHGWTGRAMTVAGVTRCTSADRMNHRATGGALPQHRQVSAAERAMGG